jgi:Calcium-activated chloride channel
LNAIDSLRILNPPHDAVDADEWFKFFHENFEGAHATSITIALDNDLLVRALVARREAMKKIELHVEPGTSLDTLTLARLSAETSRNRNFFGRFLASLSPGIPEYFCKIAELEAQIKGWAQIEYPVSNVFVSFETEAAQRRVLTALSLGSADVARNNSKALSDPKHMFRRGRDDERVLKVKEPDEPSAIRWADLNVKFKDKMKPLITTSIASVLAIACIAFLISVINNTSAVWAALAISISNSVFPMVAKALTSLERHSSEGLKQTSLYFKIAAFRWVNTAIVITVITPFTVTLANKGGLIPQIYAIFFAELVTTNSIQLLDPVGHLQRHYLAPRASTQDLVRLSIVVVGFFDQFLISNRTFFTDES